MGNLLVRLFSLSQAFNQKEWYTSKAVWLNVLAAAYAVAQYFWPELRVDAALFEEVAIAILAIVNIVLRFMTKVPITVKKG